MRPRLPPAFRLHRVPPAFRPVAEKVGHRYHARTAQREAGLTKPCEAPSDRGPRGSAGQAQCGTSHRRHPLKS